MLAVFRAVSLVRWLEVPLLARGLKEKIQLLKKIGAISLPAWDSAVSYTHLAYGISQGRLAVASGITREYLNKIESGKMKPSKELLHTLHKELARFNPEAPLTMLFDYVKIRFPTLDIQHLSLIHI